MNTITDISKITTAIVWDHRGRVPQGGKGQVEVRVTYKRKSYHFGTGVKCHKSELIAGQIVNCAGAKELNERVSIIPQTWWYGLDYMTGAATQSQQTERSIAVPASYVGTSGQLMVSVFGLSDDDEWMTDVTIKAKNDGGDVIGQVTLDDVPFIRNRVTEASGNLFGSSTSFSISLNSDSLEPYVLEW